MTPAVKCLIVLAIVALLFITELIPLAITAMSGAIADDHDTKHQTGFAGTGESNDRNTDFLCQTSMEHGSTNNEHTCEKYYC